MDYVGKRFVRKERGNCGIPQGRIVEVVKFEGGRVFFIDKFNELQSYDLGNLHVYFNEVKEND